MSSQARSLVHACGGLPFQARNATAMAHRPNRIGHLIPMSKSAYRRAGHFFGHGIADPLDAPEIGSDRLTHVHPDDLDRFLSLREGPTTLSFDDGYADNLTVALPILERHEQPATVFVTTDFVTRRSPLLARIAACVARDGDWHKPSLRQLVNHNAADGFAMYRQLRDRLKHMTVAERRRAQDALMTDYAIDPKMQTADYLTPDQLLALDAHPLITIGAHTRTHPDLRYCTDQELSDELTGARDTLEHWLGHRVDTLAYPFGDTDPRVRRAARAAGYRCAFTTEMIHWRSRVPFYGRLDIPRIDLSGEVRRMHRRARKHGA